MNYKFGVPTCGQCYGMLGGKEYRLNATKTLTLVGRRRALMNTTDAIFFTMLALPLTKISNFTKPIT
jgi:hypothetical protein